MKTIDTLERMEQETTSVTEKTALSDAIEAVSYHSAALEQKWTPCCQRCGERVTPTDRYCRKCGQKLPPFNWEGL